MLLWTIQNEKAYDEMLRNGTLRSNPRHLAFDGLFRNSYLWMSEQMRMRIGNPPAGVVFPVWAWYQWEGKRKRPDMRHHGRASEKGVPIVLLTIEAPDYRVLLSDFDYWHSVLNDWGLIFPIPEDAIYSEEDKQKSWENIFDITCSFDGEENRELSTQATLWEIRKEWVVKAEHFRTF